MFLVGQPRFDLVSELMFDVTQLLYNDALADQTEKSRSFRVPPMADHHLADTASERILVADEGAAAPDPEAARESEHAVEVVTLEAISQVANCRLPIDKRVDRQRAAPDAMRAAAEISSADAGVRVDSSTA